MDATSIKRITAGGKNKRKRWGWTNDQLPPQNNYVDLKDRQCGQIASEIKRFLSGGVNSKSSIWVEPI